MYFKPFLSIIQSDQTSGARPGQREGTRLSAPPSAAAADWRRPAAGVVTHVALSAVNKFILYGFLSPSSVHRTSEVLCRTVEAVSQCRFESIDRTVDEQVYLQVCTVLLHCIICEGGGLMTDGAVWLCVKTCYDISTTDSLS